MKDKNIPHRVKITIYKTIVQPILSYGCEAWTLTNKTTSRVQGAEMRVLRMIRRVTRRDMLSNESFRSELGVESIITSVETDQLRWYGHMKRMEEYRTPRRWYDWVLDTKRPLGRPRKRWDQNVDEAPQKQGTSLNERRPCTGDVS